MRYAILTLILIFTAAAGANEVLDLAEKDYLQAEKGMVEGYQKLIASMADPTTREVWIKLHEDWLKLAHREAAAEAGLTSGGGSAYTPDRLGNLADAFERRQAHYVKMASLINPGA